MTNEVEADITRALTGHLFRGDYGQEMDISLPGLSYTPTKNTYLRATMHLAPTEQVTGGTEGYNRYTGFMQVRVVALTGKGVLDAQRIGGRIIAHFKRGTSLTENGRVVRIIQPPYQSDPLELGNWINVPVTIRWQSDNPNVT